MATQQLYSDLNLGAFRVRLNSDNSLASIIGNSPGQPVQCQYDELLRAAVCFLSSSAVKRLIPHAALPLDESPLVLNFVVKQALNELATTYPGTFGAPDQLGVDTIPRSAPRSDSYSLRWGDGSAVLTIDRKTRAVTLSSATSISLELLTDVLITILRDPLTKEIAPEFHAPFLRRWGENAFQITHLKPGTPRALVSSVHLSPQKTVSQAGAAANYAASPSLPSETLPSAPPSTRQRRSPESLRHLQRRADALAEQEERSNKRQRTIIGRLQEIATLKEELEKQRTSLAAESAELEKAQSKVGSEAALLSQREAELTKAAAQRETNIAARERVCETNLTEARQLRADAERMLAEARAIEAELNLKLGQMISPAEK
jgi:hypothetical protein